MMKRTQTSIRWWLCITACFAFLVAAPRLLQGVRTTAIGALLITSVHQVLIATLIGYVIWRLSGRAVSLGIASAALIVFAWLPYFSTVVEQSLTGNAGYTVAAMYHTGTEDFFLRFHQITTKLFGYHFEQIA